MQRKPCILFSLIGTLFFFCCVTGCELAHQGNIVWDAGWNAKCLLFSVAGGILTGVGMGAVYSLIEQKKRSLPAGKSQSRRLPSVKSCFWISWGLIVVAWLPVYLAYYPGICAYDFTIQMGQITLGEYNEHHPLLHTLLIEGFYRLGLGVDNPTLGMGLYTICQLLILGASFAAIIAVFRKIKLSGGWLLLLQIYAMFFPFHWYMAVTITKDTYFTASFLFLLAALVWILQKSPVSLKKWGLGEGALFLSALFLILFRNNGRYALLVGGGLLGAACIFGRKRRWLYSRILISLVGAVLAGSLLLSLLMNVTNARQGDRREMLSVPIQQLARTMVYQGGSDTAAQNHGGIGEQDRALINEFLLNESYRDYRPDISDPVKRHTNTYVVVHRLKDFVSTYLRLLTEYPGDFVNAVLSLDAGYLYPLDVSHGDINRNGRDRGLGYIQTRWLEAELSPLGIEQQSCLPRLRAQLEAFADANAYQEIPVLKYVLVPGTYLWFYLILAARQLLKKRYTALVPLALVLGYYITLFLGPAVQLRYIYPAMVILPFAAVIPEGNPKQDGEESYEKDLSGNG